MKIYSKILFTTLPLVLVFIFATVGTTYYFFRSALLDLGEIWLDTQLSMALDIAKNQEQILRMYGLDKIPGSTIKAKMNTAAQIANIRVGEKGYIFAVDRTGSILFHPNKYLVDTDISQAPWFKKMEQQSGRMVLELDGTTNLARFARFAPWDWYILAVDPMVEVYGVANRMRPYLYILGILGSVILSMALMLLTRRLTRPLKALVRGASAIGKGNLTTRIPIQSKDEFGQLAREFNHMVFRLQETLTALQYSEEHFRALIENTSDLIWILDEQGNFLYVSPSTNRILGYPREDLIRKNLFDFIHPDDRPGVNQRFDLRAKSLIKPQIITHRFRHKDNFWCTIESVNKNLLKHPAIGGMVINSRNITKRKQAELALKKSHQELEGRVEERTRELLQLNKTLNNEILIRKEKERELERANQAKSEFLANVSHEIRTPLNSVIGFSQLLTTMITDKQQMVYLKTIAKAGNNLLDLINDILDLSKMEAGKLRLNTGPVCLPDLFREIRHLFNMKIMEKGLTFFIQIHPDLPQVLVLDEMRLRQVILNLVDNAIKFTKAGTVSIEAQAAPSPGGPETRADLVIRVRDSGIGIPKEKRELVFESFQQESAGTSRKFGGTGLGLSICRQIITLMDGRIAVTSEENCGSCFSIELPGVKIGPAQAPSRQKWKADLNTMRFSQEKVLVVDDHPQIRFMLREILEKLNLSVIEASNGKAALESARDHLPSVIIMDAKMPELDGLSAARKLKEDPVTLHIPICLMTASMRASSRQDSTQEIFMAQLTKPIIIKDLIKVLARVLPGKEICHETDPAPELPGLMTLLNQNRLDPQVMQQLKEKIRPELTGLLEGIKISEIQTFARKVILLGTSSGNPEVETFGRRLLDHAQTFDIEKIRFSLKDLSATLEPLAD